MTNVLRLAAVQLDCVPNALTPQRRYWVPEEPLLGANPLVTAIEPPEYSLAALCVEHEQLRFTRDQVAERYAEAVRARLLRILDFCQSAAVDIVVFPEYSVPPRLLETLIGFSSEMVIVAGIGIITSRDLEQLTSLALTDLPRTHTNAAAVFGPGLRSFVTKRHAADSEYCERGDGPSVFNVDLRGHTRRIGVAICLDYVHIGHTFQGSDQGLDVVAIPALSTNTAVFTPDQPRDFARVLANHASVGGSRVLLPRPQAAAFVDDAGSTPALAGEEVVVVCDFAGFQTAPKSTVPPKNLLVHRASVVVSPSDYQDGVLRALQPLALDGEVAPELIDKLGDWQKHLAADPAGLGLAAVLGEYRRLARSGVLHAADRKLLTTHIRLPSAASSAALRAQQATLVAHALAAVEASKTTRAAKLAYEEVAESLQARVVDEPLRRPPEPVKPDETVSSRN